MFSDDDDFSDDLLEIDSSSNSMPAPAVNAEEEFRELIKQQERIQKEMKRVDELAKQVKFALELQKAMLDCYSNRVSSLPIETQLEVSVM
ncbi:hypothetical protein GCK32_012922 [Trichostrongylus colubriformis]|uniref:Uncharacterized protein n=1 Tax=Trichostrongylus colubriformis TaxID=6319 RepID=A0AAN8IC50_TRICO